MIRLPRLMFSALASGGGKTTAACAFLSLLKERGLDPCAFKCGPDYIDPMFHRTVLGVDSWNLDLFFSPASQVRELMARRGGGHGIAVLEGAMGYYDGVGNSTQASSWELARETETPAVLVLDPAGSALTLAAQVRGLLEFRSPSCIRGILLSRCSEKRCNSLAPILERETGLRVYGALPFLEDCAFLSRHLGLVTPEDGEDTAGKIRRLARQLERSADVEGLIALASQAPPLTSPPPRPAPAERAVRIGVARDRAFCFYYEENLSMLEELGAELVPFSPLEDARLPGGLHGLYLGGGYPELHARPLSERREMLAAVRQAAERGMPILAECGGFLYLQKSLTDREGACWPMAGVLEGEGYPVPRQDRFGYITLTAQQDTPFLHTGESIAAHEFHRWECSRCGEACLAEKPGSTRRWSCITAQGKVFAGFPHLYFPSCPDFPRRFVQACTQYKEDRSCSNSVLTN